MKFVLVLLFIILCVTVLMWASPTAGGATPEATDGPPAAFTEPEGTRDQKAKIEPVEELIKPLRKTTYETRSVRTVTAYNSVREQTDSEPCLAADGTDVCKGLGANERVCAANDYEFGTTLAIPGFGECVVRDRVNARYPHRIDLYFGGREGIKAAREWGKRTLEITIIKPVYVPAP